MSIQKVSTVIFDAGGVLHEINSVISAIKEDLLNELKINKETLAHIWKDDIQLLGSGKITEDELWERVSNNYKIRQVTSDENLLGRTFKERLTPFVEVKKLVEDLHNLRIKTAILSNTIEPHAKVCREVGIYENFSTVLLSHEIGLRKPDPKIYLYTLKVLGVKPDTIIFIDDDPKNTLAAEQVGIHGIVFTNPAQTRNDLKQFIPEL